jgi:hypothetical protein
LSQLLAEVPVAQFAPHNAGSDTHKWAYLRLPRSGKWRRKACLSCQLLEQDFPCDMAGLQDTGVGERVMDFCSYALGFYYAPLAHNGQVLADFRLALSCCLDKVFHRSWHFTKQVEEFQACRVGKSLAEVCLQSIELFFSFLVHVLCSFAGGININIFELMNIITIGTMDVKPLLLAMALHLIIGTTNGGR